jgi:hypothetical protein
MKWIEDPRSERVMGELGLKFAVETVKLSDIDWIKSINNPGRMGPSLDDEKVTDYAIAMLDGAEFFMAVVRRVGTTLITMGGNHRLASAKEAGLKTAKVYIVDFVEDIVADILPCRLNQVEGDRMSRPELVARAVDLCRRHKMSITDAAEAMGLKRNWVDHAVRIEVMRDELENEGVNTVGVNPSTLKAMMGLKSNTNVMVDFAKAVIKTKPTIKQVADMVREVKKRKTEKAQKEEVKEWRQRLEDQSPRKRGKLTLTKRSMLFMHLEGLDRVLDKVERLESLGLDVGEMGRLKATWKSARRQLNSLLLPKNGSL